MDEVKGDGARFATLEDVVMLQFEELRVSGATQTRPLATSILRYFDEGRRVALSCIGAQAAAQALKAVACANGELASQGRLLAIIPTFDIRRQADRVTGEEIELTAIRLIVGKLPIML